MNFIVLLLISFSLWAQIDPDATPEARQLYSKLTNISLSINDQQTILLGQQNAFTEGRGWRLDNRNLGQELKSDMHDVACIHPAVLGLDFGEIGSWNKELMIEHMREVNRRGGVVTISWHMSALIDDGKGDGGYKDTTTKVVEHILPGGYAHQKLVDKLDTLAKFFQEVSDVPIIFRPWHEHNFSWFWWGEDHCSKEDYIRLWKFTVDHLRARGVHHLLYAYSPNQIRDDYLERYPGDDYVDILGGDHYFYNRLFDWWSYGLKPLTEFKRGVIWLMQEAERRNKIPALTEFGLETSNYRNFWTDYMSWPVEREGMEQRLGHGNAPKRGFAYMMLWRNDIKDPKHYFGPISGHKNNANFLDMLSKKIFKGL